MGAIPSPEGIDKLIHERARLGIMSSLAAAHSMSLRAALSNVERAAGTMTFNELKETLGMTDGNLSVHARVLEEAGYIRIEKKFVARKPQTTMSLTAKGTKAFKDYVAYLESILAPKKAKSG